MKIVTIWQFLLSLEMANEEDLRSLWRKKRALNWIFAQNFSGLKIHKELNVKRSTLSSFPSFKTGLKSGLCYVSPSHLINTKSGKSGINANSNTQLRLREPFKSMPETG